MRSLRAVVVMLCLVLVGALAPTITAHAAANQKGSYTPLAAARILDTRKPTGVPVAGPLGSGETLDLQVSNAGGVPASGVSAVVLNLTITGATANGYLAAYPTGGSRPGVSAINFTKGVALANISTVPLGSGGKITIYNSNGGSVQVIADVMGFYAANDVPSQTTGPGAEFESLAPQRLVDTRTDPAGPLAANEILDTYVDFQDGNDDVKALALNITATGAQSGGYLTVWNGKGKAPTSTLNYRVGTTIANMAVVQTSRCSGCSTPEPVQFSVYNGSTRAVGVVIDMVGVYYYDGTTVGLRFSPVTPVRISDSRKAMNGAPLTPQQTQTVTAPSSVLGTNTVALVANAAVIAPTASTYMTLWRTGDTRPGVSNLNVSKGTTAANGAFPGLSAAHQFNVFNLAGNGNFIVDVTGRFDGIAQQAVQRRASQPHDFTSPNVSHQRSYSSQR